MIHGHIEKALDLRGVQIHRQHAIGPSPRDAVGHEFGRDRYATFILAILARVTIVRNHRGNSRGAGAFATINHDEQFHQIVVDWWAGRLNQKDVPAADIVTDLARVLAIRKST